MRHCQQHCMEAGRVPFEFTSSGTISGGRNSGDFLVRDRSRRDSAIPRSGISQAHGDKDAFFKEGVETPTVRLVPKNLHQQDNNDMGNHDSCAKKGFLGDVVGSKAEVGSGVLPKVVGLTTLHGKFSGGLVADSTCHSPKIANKGSEGPTTISKEVLDTGVVKGIKSWKRIARAKGKVAKKVVVGPKHGVAFCEGL